MVWLVLTGTILRVLKRIVAGRWIAAPGDGVVHDADRHTGRDGEHNHSKTCPQQPPDVRDDRQSAGDKGCRHHGYKHPG